MDWIVSLTPEFPKTHSPRWPRPPMAHRSSNSVSICSPRSTSVRRSRPVRCRSLRRCGPPPRAVAAPTTRRPAPRSSRAARDAGATLIDLEHARDSRLIAGLGLTPEQVVVSWHDPTGTPADLETIAAGLLESPARMVKLIPTAANLADLERVLGLHQRFNHRRSHNRRLLTFAMGTVGIASRYLAPLLGPPLSFAAWREGAAAAPGQLTVAQLEAVVGHLAGRPRRLFGVVGRDVSRSLSPALHCAGYRALGLPGSVSSRQRPGRDRADRGLHLSRRHPLRPRRPRGPRLGGDHPVQGDRRRCC